MKKNLKSWWKVFLFCHLPVVVGLLVCRVAYVLPMRAKVRYVDMITTIHTTALHQRESDIKKNVVEIEWCWRCSLKWNYNENFHDSIWVDMFNNVVGVCRIVFQFSSQQNEERQQRQSTWAYFQFHLVSDDTKQHNKMMLCCMMTTILSLKTLTNSNFSLPCRNPHSNYFKERIPYPKSMCAVEFFQKICHATSK